MIRRSCDGRVHARMEDVRLRISASKGSYTASDSGEGGREVPVVSASVCASISILVLVFVLKCADLPCKRVRACLALLKPENPSTGASGRDGDKEGKRDDRAEGCRGVDGGKNTLEEKRFNSDTPEDKEENLVLSRHVLARVNPRATEKPCRSCPLIVSCSREVREDPVYICILSVQRPAKLWFSRRPAARQFDRRKPWKKDSKCKKWLNLKFINLSRRSRRVILYIHDTS